MKYAQSSVIFTSLLLSTSVIGASKVASEQERSASGFLSYFGFGKKAPAVPANTASSEGKEDVEEPWILVNEDDDEYLTFKAEHVTKDEIKAHNQEMKREALERYEKKRLTRVRKAEEDEALLSAVLPREPKVSAKWYQRTAPVLVQMEEAIMMTEPEDEQPNEDAEEVIFKGEQIEDADQQPPMMDDEVPEAPMMDEEVPEAPAMDAPRFPKRAPVVDVTESVSKPKDPNVFRGKTLQMGLSKSDESAASMEEASLIQKFKLGFQNAGTFAERKYMIDSMAKIVKENPGFMELHKLKVQLLLQLNRELIQDESEDESEEDTQFD